jgi:Ca-activated chloride channel family protein
MNTFDLFHFIRPMWLVAIPLLAIIWWLVRRREAATTLVGDLVATHLADALTVNPSGRNGFRPVDGVVIAAITMAVAAAGPTWSKQPSPWFAETAPLVIAIEVSDSMRSNDLQPTRLDRARFRVLDLIRARTGSRTAIIAYSGSAHIVVPPSKDIDVLEPLLESLDPAIMPLSGADASAVLPLAQNLLGTDAPIGTVLFVNDGFSPADVPALAEFSAEPGAASLLALVVGTDEGGVALMPDGSPVMADGGGRLDTGVDAGTLRRIENEAGIPVIRASTTGDDVGRLTRMIASNLQQADDPEAQWRDQGWWLLWPAAFLALLWFRRGWTSQW